MERGTLYLIGTPIGNLKDITLRAIETLSNVDVILAEDTRQTLKLLNHLNIKKRMISYHRHNEMDKIQQVVTLLEQGKNVGLVSDAGMPIISDPGEQLVKYLVLKQYKIEVIPGPTAFVTAIVKSGMDSTRFTFEGFLSVNKKQRKERLYSLKTEPRTMIFYEAPHKIVSTLKDMLACLGDREIVIARELTKLHEEFLYETISTILEKIEQVPLKGEIVLLVKGAKQETEIVERKLSYLELVQEKMKEGIEKKEAIKLVAKECKVTKNEVYKECIEL